MEYEAKLMEHEEIGVEKQAAKDIKKVVKSYQKHGFPESEIKEEIFANFHDNFTPEELNKLIQEGLHS